LSAVFEVSDTHSDELVVRGSPVLVKEICKQTEKVIKVEDAGTILRAPMVCIEGSLASSIAQPAVVQYGKYVAALFNNFD
jgi:hypothetical protein